MDIIRTANAVFLRTGIVEPIQTSLTTAEVVESMTREQSDFLAILAAQWVREQHGWGRPSIYYVGRCMGRDAFTLTVQRASGKVVETTVEIGVGLADLGARDRQRRALARAHRSAGIALSVGGAQ